MMMIMMMIMIMIMIMMGENTYSSDIRMSGRIKSSVHGCGESFTLTL